MKLHHSVEPLAWQRHLRVYCIEVDLPLPPEVAVSKDGELRLDYHPPIGLPPPNITFHPLDVKDGILVDDVIPGTEYAFQLYYSNRSMTEVLTWTTVIATEPDPPSNLSVDVQTGKIVDVVWDPPIMGGYSGYKLAILSSEDDLSPRSFDLAEDSLSFTLQDLTPGASYEVQLSTLYQEKESSVFISSNFTTKPNTPGRFIVWFRNETTLLVLWQPPYPSGIFDEYRVSISPEDAVQSVLFVEKEGEPPGPAQAAFYGLVPGRAYNISVQTVSHSQISEPTEAQYRTVPLPPTNVTYSKSTLASYSFDATWSLPKSLSEFDRYQVALGIRNSVRQTIGKSENRRAHFDEGLEPGRTYEVIVKTVSGNVASWPSAVNITTRPLSVINLNSTAIDAGEILIQWQPHNSSLQDSYLVSSHELEIYNGDGIPQIVHETQYRLGDLLPGRNYSISVVALSQEIPSDVAIVYQATRPSSPVIEMLEPVDHGWNISWKSDVTSRQDSYSVVWIRNDTGQVRTNTTKDNWLWIDNLYSGASYEIKVYALSYGLESEPHSYYQTVAPKPPHNVQIVKASNSTMILTWISPNESVIDHYVVRYRPFDSILWKEVVIANATSCEIKKLDSGEKYQVQVVSMSNKVESPDAKVVEQTMYPNPIKHVRHILDSYNITFEWNIPPGKKDYYIINYYPVKAPFPQLSHQVFANDSHSEGTMTCMISDLKSGELYSFLFYVVSHSLRSEGIGLQTRTKPVIDSVIHIVTDEQETQTLGIKYTPTPIRNVVFDRYRFQLSGTNIPAQEKLQNDTNRLVIFDDLIPGRLYNISIWTVSGGVYSVPIDRQARLYPESVGEIMAPKITDTEITLTWNIPDGDKDGYEVQYQDHEGNLIKNVTILNRISYNGLRPHHNYTFLVSVLSGYDTSTTIRGRPISRTFHTLESVPGKVNNFVAVHVKPNVITLQWTLPSSEQNGILTGFVITYFVKGSLFHQYEKFGPSVVEGVIKNLLPGKTYIFEIQAHTKVGPGGKATLEQTLPLGAPPPPASNVFPINVGKSSTTAKVQFRKNFFSHSHGPVTGYAVIVAEDDSLDSKQQKLPSWNDVQKYSRWPPYQVSEPFYPFNGTSSIEFTIGTEDCTNVKGYCNGPLKPGTSYKVKVRAFTAPEKFTDTVYSYTFQTETDNTAMLAGITVSLVLILLLITIVLVVRRKKRNGPFAKKVADGHSKDDSMSIPESEIITSRPVKLKDFPDHYRFLSADSDFRFSEEFELLKHVGRDKLCNAADLPVNRPKNRFTNILPYDHSRVKLMPSDDEEGSDYINANYIPGYNSPREFIVTQGPLHSTRDDFWRMIWEQNSRAVVMLTRCVEKGREKCDHYWPYDTQPAYYGDIQVTILNESQYSKWTISEFKVSRGDQSRIIRHFHFTTWPDFGVPDPPQTLVKFVRTFRDRILPDNKPIVVHCSAGVGRSGTFIALDHILQKIQKHDYVDIFSIVYEMRKERVWMVQNEQQYICIHQCLMCVLDGNEDMDPLRQEVHDNQGYEDDEGIAESGI
ncbi:tyrosine-protein phosphatase 10D [Trichonephila inaurata madagascariensis]|uniref:protein-tyrosine-phosphatase n=1 Tax=Trichonephila inaurata madagascariensis TaxID=2747483 RepID=A0A8X7CJ60_9ARAC|nr:tyrosine-protein phosphatase 10D [Trichonephila inaurata madagascariensis]